MDAEQLRREEARRKNASLRKRGLSLSEQRSGSVREDSWDTCNSFLHDETRSREVVLRFGSKRRWGSACLRPGRMKLQRIATIAVAFMLMGPTPGQAAAVTASNPLLLAIDQMLHIFRDDTLKDRSQTQTRRRALRAVMEGVIDFPDVAQRALGPHWQARTELERGEFVAIFKDLMTYSYIATMETYVGQNMRLVAESKNEDLTSVVTKVQGRQGRPSSVEYRMHRREDRWLVYDIFVDGVSLVGNYRAQFNTLVRTSSYAELLRRMRARVTELTTASRASAGASVHRDRWHAEFQGWMREVVVPAMR